MTSTDIAPGGTTGRGTRMKRMVGVALAALLAVGVVLAVVLGPRIGRDDPGAGSGNGAGAAGATTSGLRTVRGAVGSEKEAFFRDATVRQAFARHGLDVQVTPVGSRDIAAMTDLATYDFAFPSSVPAADRIRRAGKSKGTYSPFFSPIAVASYRPIVDVLRRQGIVASGPGGAQTISMAKYYALAQKGTRWDQIPGNDAYPAGKNVLITTTDVRRSNSAAMYLALTSYVANGGRVVPSSTAAAQVVPKVSPLFLDQGYVGGSSEGPFEDYLSAGMGKTPMVLIYESQFLDRQIRKDGSITPDMVLLYPTPDVLSKHTLVALGDTGSQVGRLLTSDPELVRAAARYGFRPQQRAVLTSVLKEAGVAPPPDLVDVIEPPTYEVLESLITGVEKLYG